MEIKTRLLVAIFILTAIAALILTWAHVPAYLGNGLVQANVMFWKDALFNTSPSGKFLAIDLLFLAFACNVWVFIEGRRLNIRFLYAYVIAGILIAISVAFPLFLAARELKMASQAHCVPPYSLKAFDVGALLLLFASAVLAGIAALQPLT